MIIVTGATGFIGSNLLAELEARGYTEIVGIDSFGTGNKWMNVANRSHVRFIMPENTFTFLGENADRIKAVIHLGAISTTTEHDVDLIFKNNVEFTIKLYDFCKKHGTPLIYASSAATYGHQMAGVLCEDNESLEHLQKLWPLNPYGWSKLFMDKFISIDRASGTPSHQVVGLRFFNVYGPHEYHKGAQASVILHFYRQMLEEGTIKVFKTASEDYPKGAARDFVFVEDCVDVMVWMMEHPDVSGLFNVGTGTAVTYEEIAENVSRCMNRETNIRYIPMPEGLPLQYQFFTQARLDKLRSVGYTKAMTGIQEGIAKYYPYLDHLSKHNLFKYK